MKVNTDVRNMTTATASAVENSACIRMGKCVAVRSNRCRSRRIGIHIDEDGVGGRKEGQVRHTRFARLCFDLFDDSVIV